ncbi:hypothetical protein [Microcoleus sp. MOSTC5]
MKASANQPIAVEKVIKKENITTFVLNAIVNRSLMMSPKSVSWMNYTLM